MSGAVFIVICYCYLCHLGLRLQNLQSGTGIRLSLGVFAYQVQRLLMYLFSYCLVSYLVPNQTVMGYAYAEYHLCFDSLHRKKYASYLADH